MATRAPQRSRSRSRSVCRSPTCSGSSGPRSPCSLRSCDTASSAAGRRSKRVPKLPRAGLRTRSWRRWDGPTLTRASTETCCACNSRPVPPVTTQTSRRSSVGSGRTSTRRSNVGRAPTTLRSWVVRGGDAAERRGRGWRSHPWHHRSDQACPCRRLMISHTRLRICSTGRWQRACQAPDARSLHAPICHCSSATSMAGALGRHPSIHDRHCPHRRPGRSRPLSNTTWAFALYVNGVSVAAGTSLDTRNGDTGVADTIGLFGNGCIKHLLRRPPRLVGSRQQGRHPGHRPGRQCGRWRLPVDPERVHQHQPGQPGDPGRRHDLQLRLDERGPGHVRDAQPRRRIGARRSTPWSARSSPARTMPVPGASPSCSASAARTTTAPPRRSRPRMRGTRRSGSGLLRPRPTGPSPRACGVDACDTEARMTSGLAEPHHTLRRD